MCRLAAWIGESVALEDIVTKPSHSLIEQSQAANEAKLSVNGDGFGFAWYDDAGRLGVYKDVLPAWTDGNLLSLSSMIRSPLFLAHVRASTYGHISRSNCHPFKSARWSFAHNGQIADFDKYRRRLEQSLTDARYSERTGNTDSELLFLMLLDHGLEDNALNACTQVIDLVTTVTKHSKKPMRISAVFSDGDTLYVLRYSSDECSPSLYYKLCDEKGIIVASEPLDENVNQWVAIRESALTRISGLHMHSDAIVLFDNNSVDSLRHRVVRLTR